VLAIVNIFVVQISLVLSVMAMKLVLGVLRTLLTPLMTTFWWWFLASVRRNLWPTSSKALLSCTFILRFISMFSLFFLGLLGHPAQF
jgi:hypothetical protein